VSGVPKPMLDQPFASVRDEVRQPSRVRWQQRLSTLLAIIKALPGTLSAGMQLQALRRELDDQRRQLEVRTVMDWIAQAHVEAGPLVSVILPTRDRRQLLQRAIDSVRAQTYPRWELLVVDDGSSDETPAYLDGIGDQRLRSFRAAGKGVCAARNVALRESRGDLIAYLDDDNVMHPQWLKSVVWCFQQRPDANVLYGAFIVDDTARIDRVGSGDMPRLHFHAYDHQAVATDNIADMSCIAHRARLPELQFDESLREMGDWDLFLRLTRNQPPVALPAAAAFYYTDAPNRLSNGPRFQEEVAKIRRKNAR
jgi:glycosyltransferase involved in cell wall biosynthesis